MCVLNLNADTMREKLTVLIPCRDECDNILPCIESIRTIADEILVADSGSTDGTYQIALSVPGCRVIRREWNGYAAFKNWAIAKAKHPWVLIIDADERVSPELADEIAHALTSPPQRILAYRIRYRTFFLGHEIRYSGKNTNTSCRLIRRDACRYKDMRVHEDIDVPLSRVGKLKHRFIHYEYRSYDHYFAKRLKYTRLAAEDRWHNGKRASFASLLLSPFLRFVQLYFFRLGFLDGLPGIQLCILTAFVNSFVKQGRLWEMQSAVPQATIEHAAGTLPDQAPRLAITPQSPQDPPQDPDDCRIELCDRKEQSDRVFPRAA